MVLALILVVVAGLQLTFAARIAERLGSVRGVAVPAWNKTVVFTASAVLGIATGATGMGVGSGVLAVMSCFGTQEVARPTP